MGCDSQRLRVTTLGTLPVSLSELLREVVRYHGKVRGRQAVLTPGAADAIDTTRPDWQTPDVSATGLFEGWGRGYYVDSLWSIVAGLEGDREVSP